MQLLLTNPTESISELTAPVPDGKRFGPTLNSLGLLRTSIDSNNGSGLSIVNKRYRFSVDLQKSGTCPYRSEFTDWPWMLNLPKGTKEKIKFDYYFISDINNQSPISIFQTFVKDMRIMLPDGFSEVGQQLELSGYNQLKYPGTNTYAPIGELQVINNVTNVRKLVGVVAKKGDKWRVEIDTFFETAANGGYFKVTINGVVVYNATESTIFPESSYCPQPKIGIYHHYLRTDADQWKPININAGHTKFELEAGRVAIARTSPGENFPSYINTLMLSSLEDAVGYSQLQADYEALANTYDSKCSELSTISSKYNALKFLIKQVNSIAVEP